MADQAVQCPYCGYAMAEGPRARCPECGRATDTARLAGQRARLWRRCVQVIGWSVLGLAAARGVSAIVSEMPRGSDGSSGNPESAFHALCVLPVGLIVGSLGFLAMTSAVRRRSAWATMVVSGGWALGLALSDWTIMLPARLNPLEQRLSALIGWARSAAPVLTPLLLAGVVVVLARAGLIDPAFGARRRAVRIVLVLGALCAVAAAAEFVAGRVVVSCYEEQVRLQTSGSISPFSSPPGGTPMPGSGGDSPEWLRWQELTDRGDACRLVEYWSLGVRGLSLAALEVAVGLTLVLLAPFGSARGGRAEEGPTA